MITYDGVAYYTTPEAMKLTGVRGAATWNKLLKAELNLPEKEQLLIPIRLPGGRRHYFEKTRFDAFVKRYKQPRPVYRV